MGQKKGFTLIEMLVVMAIFMIISVIIIPLGLSTLQDSKVSSEAKKIDSTFFTTQQNGYSGYHNIAHGIAFFSDRYELFEGNSRATATNFDVFYIPNNMYFTSINFNGSTELLFARNSFRPTNSGSLVISDGNFSYLISINKEGLISHNEI